ncbi:unnamed protein product [Sphagnum troendelagicum]|uniref:Uncharacterized protein n=1 Tax=Sphagnum troendelagicum TaxID=128251 RepID=A0ABP0TNG0_9BRYO
MCENEAPSKLGFQSQFNRLRIRSKCLCSVVPMSVVSYSVLYQGVSITAQIACVGLSNAGIILSQQRDCYLNGCAWDTTSHKLQFEIRQIGKYAPWQCCCLYLEEVQVKEAGNPVWATIDSFLANPSAKLRNLQLMGIPMFPPPVNLNLDRIACLFPCLDHLSLGYRMVEDSLPVETQFRGCTVLEKVRFVELWFPQPKLDYTIVLLMGETLKRCPSLRKLQLTSLHDSTVRREFMTPFVKLVRQFSHVDIQFA